MGHRQSNPRQSNTTKLDGPGWGGGGGGEGGGSDEGDRGGHGEFDLFVILGTVKN